MLTEVNNSNHDYKVQSNNEEVTLDTVQKEQDRGVIFTLH